MGIGDKYDALVPTSMNDLIALADRVSKSTIIPVAYRGKPADCLVAMSLGLEVGLKPMAALQSICVINGNPGIFGTAARALVMATGQLQSITETDPADVEKDGHARCEIIRKGYSEPFVGDWTLEKAKKAGLAGKDNHQKYPSTMLAWRAFHDAARKAFPDVYKGLAVAEELQEIQPGVWARPEDATVTVALDAPVTQKELDQSKREFPDGDIGVDDHGSVGDQKVGERITPKRGRPPKPQEPQAPQKAVEVTPLSPVVAAPVSPDPAQPESCGFCHDAELPRGHTFNTCPRNRVDEGGDADGLPRGFSSDNAVAAPATAGAAASNGRTLNDEEQAEIRKMAKLLRPQSADRWLREQVRASLVEELDELPADEMKNLIRRMQANA